jgi:hypothetical protein
MLRSVALVRTDISDEYIASITRVTRIGELRTSAVASNRLFLYSMLQLLVTANIVLSSTILVTLMMEVPPKRRFTQEPHAVTSQKTQFFSSLDSLKYIF